MFPKVIDNSMRKAFVSCPTKFMRRYIEGIMPIGLPSVDLHFGVCFAKGIENARKAYWQEDNQLHAVEKGIADAQEAWGGFQAPSLSNKTLARLIGAIRFYFEQWPLDSEVLVPVDNGIEYPFTILLPIKHPETGSYLSYAGRFDAFTRHDNSGRYYVVDEKTTSRLGESWFMQWDMDSQMTGYIWAAKYFLDGDAEVMAQVRGISILRNEYGHAEVPIVRSAYMINQWYAQLLEDIERMLECYKVLYWDKALSNACTEYGRPCDYAMLCKSADPHQLIEGNFKEERWNPLARK